MMAGVYVARPQGYGLTEWNAIGDPHATAIVFAARPPAVQCVGLEVTTRCQMPADEFRKRFSEGPRKIVHAFGLALLAVALILTASRAALGAALLRQHPALAPPAPAGEPVDWRYDSQR